MSQNNLPAVPPKTPPPPTNTPPSIGIPAVLSQKDKDHFKPSSFGTDHPAQDDGLNIPRTEREGTGAAHYPPPSTAPGFHPQTPSRTFYSVQYTPATPISLRLVTPPTVTASSPRVQKLIQKLRNSPDSPSKLSAPPILPDDVDEGEISAKELFRQESVTYLRASSDSRHETAEAILGSPMKMTVSTDDDDAYGEDDTDESQFEDAKIVGSSSTSQQEEGSHTTSKAYAPRVYQRAPVQVRARKDRSRKQKIRSRPLNLKGGLQLGDTHEGRLELSARGQPWYDDREPISSREDFYRRKIVEQADSSPRVVIDDQVRRQVLTRRAKAWKKAAKHRRRASSSTNEASSVPGNAGVGDEKHTLAIPVIDAQQTSDLLPAMSDFASAITECSNDQLRAVSEVLNKQILARERAQELLNHSRLLLEHQNMPDFASWQGVQSEPKTIQVPKLPAMKDVSSTSSSSETVTSPAKQYESLHEQSSAPLSLDSRSPLPETSGASAPTLQASSNALGSRKTSVVFRGRKNKNLPQERIWFYLPEIDSKSAEKKQFLLDVNASKEVALTDDYERSLLPSFLNMDVFDEDVNPSSDAASNPTEEHSVATTYTTRSPRRVRFAVPQEDAEMTVSNDPDYLSQAPPVRIFDKGKGKAKAPDVDHPMQDERLMKSSDELEEEQMRIALSLSVLDQREAAGETVESERHAVEKGWWQHLQEQRQASELMFSEDALPSHHKSSADPASLVGNVHHWGVVLDSEASTPILDTKKAGPSSRPMQTPPGDNTKEINSTGSGPWDTWLGQVDREYTTLLSSAKSIQMTEEVTIQPSISVQVSPQVKITSPTPELVDSETFSDCGSITPRPASPTSDVESISPQKVPLSRALLPAQSSKYLGSPSVEGNWRPSGTKRRASWSQAEGSYKHAVGLLSSALIDLSDDKETLPTGGSEDQDLIPRPPVRPPMRRSGWTIPDVGDLHGADLPYLPAHQRLQAMTNPRSYAERRSEISVSPRAIHAAVRRAASGQGLSNDMQVLSKPAKTLDQRRAHSAGVDHYTSRPFEATAIGALLRPSEHPNSRVPSQFQAPPLSELLKQSNSALLTKGDKPFGSSASPGNASGIEATPPLAPSTKLVESGPGPSTGTPGSPYMIGTPLANDMRDTPDEGDRTARKAKRRSEVRNSVQGLDEEVEMEVIQPDIGDPTLENAITRRQSFTDRLAERWKRKSWLVAQRPAPKPPVEDLAPTPPPKDQYGMSNDTAAGGQYQGVSRPGRPPASFGQSVEGFNLNPPSIPLPLPPIPAMQAPPLFSIAEKDETPQAQKAKTKTVVTTALSLEEENELNDRTIAEQARLARESAKREEERKAARAEKNKELAAIELERKIKEAEAMAVIDQIDARGEDPTSVLLAQLNAPVRPSNFATIKASAEIDDAGDSVQNWIRRPGEFDRPPREDLELAGEEKNLVSLPSPYHPDISSTATEHPAVARGLSPIPSPPRETEGEMPIVWSATTDDGPQDAAAADAEEISENLATYPPASQARQSDDASTQREWASMADGQLSWWKRVFRRVRMSGIACLGRDEREGGADDRTR